MVEPKRALVRPRVFSPSSGEILILEEEVQRFLDSGKWGAIQLSGPAGSGKTTALEHLAAALAHESRLDLLDNPSQAQLAAGDGFGRLLVYVSPTTPAIGHLARYQLAPWTSDDLIEYLLAAHKDHCASVMARLPAADRVCLHGVPQLWVIVLDHLARDDSLSTLRAALHQHLETQLPDTDAVERSRSGCLNVLALGGMSAPQAAQELAKPGFPRELLAVLRHDAVQVLLASERIAADLHAGNDCDYLARRLLRELISATAAIVKNDPEALAHLNRLLDGPPWSHAMTASLLLAVDPDWRPVPGCIPILDGAYLSGARWASVKLAGANLEAADLEAADLRQSALSQADARGANLRFTWLHGAILEQLDANGADLSQAELSSVRAESVNFHGANLSGANVDDAVLRAASLSSADLTHATLRGADLHKAVLSMAKLAEADFSGANLADAILKGLPLREANFAGACFMGAQLCQADLEGMKLPHADFALANLKGALLTGTVMPGAKFHGACLAGAYLAEIDWEGASLNGADLRGASFHMGSSRSGLVFSPIACEGSKTGFYTDEFDEQLYKAPEEIRKANLCGADLRGAKIDNVDFYLVDLRGAKYDADQAIHFRRCGAILQTRR